MAPAASAHISQSQITPGCQSWTILCRSFKHPLLCFCCQILPKPLECLACPGTAYSSTWSRRAALLRNRAAPAPTAQHHGESDDPRQGSFTQPQRHLLLNYIRVRGLLPNFDMFFSVGEQPRLQFLLENTWSFSSLKQFFSMGFL